MAFGAADPAHRPGVRGGTRAPVGGSPDVLKAPGHPRAWLLTILRNTNKTMHRLQRPDLVENPTAQLGARPAFGVAGHPGPEEVHVNRILNEEGPSAASDAEHTLRVLRR